MAIADLSIGELFRIAPALALRLTLPDPPPALRDLAILSEMHLLAAGLDDEAMRAEVAKALGRATVAASRRIEQVGFEPVPSAA